MKWFAFFVFCCFSAGASRGWGDSPDRLPDRLPGRFSAAVSLRQDIEYLASEELRGRSVADDSIDVAADYVAKRMTETGLDMTVMGGTAFQSVPIQLEAQAGPAAHNFARFSFTPSGSEANTELKAELGIDMSPMSVGSLTGRLTGRLRAPVAFVGYGITAPQHQYDDYRGVDVSGHVVIILRKEPQAADPDSPFDGARNSRHAFFATKILNAIENGAVAIIFVNDAASAERETQQMKTRIEGELGRRKQLVTQREALPIEAINNRQRMGEKIAGIDSMVASMQTTLRSKQRGLIDITAAGNPPPNQATVPVVSVTRQVVSELLSRTLGQSLLQIESRIDLNLLPQTHLFDKVHVDLRCDVTPTTRASNNVIGVLPGRGRLAEETVIIGAHYDHVGMGGVGSLAPGTIAIHNGADDNASGVAAMLAVAPTLRSRLASVADHRRVVFIAFTGEERGLLGSKHYVRHPRFPLKSTVAMVNLDMVGRLRDNDLTVYGTGSADAMDEIVTSANDLMLARGEGFNLFKVPTGYGPSDHQSFYEAKIPVLFFFTGLHNDYHRPSDDFVKIDFGGLVRITDTVSESSFQLAVRPERPRYGETEKRFKMRWQRTAFLGIELSDSPLDEDHRVLTIASVTRSGPADQAGIQPGDQLIQIGQHPVGRSSDVMESMRGRRPGEQLEVRIIRAGERLVLNVILAPQP